MDQLLHFFVCHQFMRIDLMPPQVGYVYFRSFFARSVFRVVASFNFSEHSEYIH